MLDWYTSQICYPLEINSLLLLLLLLLLLIECLILTLPISFQRINLQDSFDSF